MLNWWSKSAWHIKISLLDFFHEGPSPNFITFWVTKLHSLQTLPVWERPSKLLTSYNQENKAHRPKSEPKKQILGSTPNVELELLQKGHKGTRALTEAANPRAKNQHYWRRAIPAPLPEACVWKCSAVFRRAAAPASSSSLFRPVCKPAQYFYKGASWANYFCWWFYCFFLKTTIIAGFKLYLFFMCTCFPHWKEHGTIYVISSDFGDRMTTQSMRLMFLLSEHF